LKDRESFFRLGGERVEAAEEVTANCVCGRKHRRAYKDSYGFPRSFEGEISCRRGKIFALLCVCGNKNWKCLLATPSITRSELYWVYASRVWKPIESYFLTNRSYNFASSNNNNNNNNIILSNNMWCVDKRFDEVRLQFYWWVLESKYARCFPSDDNFEQVPKHVNDDVGHYFLEMPFKISLSIWSYSFNWLKICFF